MEQHSPPIAVLVADDHQLVRELVVGLLQREAGMDVSHAEDLDGVLRAIAQRGGFDAVLLDYHMPGVEGMEGVRQTLAANAGRPVLLMSGNLPEDVVAEAMALGVAGFVPKTQFKMIGPAVRAAVDAGGHSRAPSGSAHGQELTETERQVLSYLCEGGSSEAIATRLGGPAELETHLQAICLKLGARNRTHAVLAAKRLGLV